MPTPRDKSGQEDGRLRELLLGAADRLAVWVHRWVTAAMIRDGADAGLPHVEPAGAAAELVRIVGVDGALDEAAIRLDGSGHKGHADRLRELVGALQAVAYASTPAADWMVTVDLVTRLELHLRRLLVVLVASPAQSQSDDEPAVVLSATEDLVLMVLVLATVGMSKLAITKTLERRRSKRDPRTVERALKAMEAVTFVGRDHRGLWAVLPRGRRHADKMYGDSPADA